MAPAIVVDGVAMAVINLAPPVVTSQTDLLRVQQAVYSALAVLITSPWGDGVLVEGVPLPSVFAGVQTLIVRHGLGRVPTGATIWNCNVPIEGPWNLMHIDNTTCSLQVNLPTAVWFTDQGLVDIWVG